MAEKGFKVLNLSKVKISHKNVFNKFVSFSDVPIYLNAADVAVIWRIKSIGNQVASPVKFSEYICCGLPVISNNSVDMISSYITKNECGLLIDKLDDLDNLSLYDLKQKDRKRISETGVLNFGSNKIVDQYLRTYTSMNNLGKNMAIFLINCCINAICFSMNCFWNLNNYLYIN